MRTYWLLLLTSFTITVLPFLGFPSAFDRVITIGLGAILTMYFLLVLRKLYVQTPLESEADKTTQANSIDGIVDNTPS